MSRRNLLFATVTLFLTFLGSLLAGEITLRMFGSRPYSGVSRQGWAMPDPILGWRNSPGTSLSQDFGNAPMTFSDDGLRATTSVAPADFGRERVVLVGGSWLQGYGLRDEETLAWRLSERFSGHSIENHGTGAYGTYQSLLKLQQIFSDGKPTPSLAIYVFPYFHARRNVLVFEWLYALRTLGGQRFGAPHVVLDSGNLVSKSSFTISDWPFERYSAAITRLHSSYYRYRLRGRPQQMVAATKLLLTQMRELTHRNRSRFLVLIVEDEENPELYTDFMDEEGINFINCTHSGINDPRFKLGGSGHPTPAINAHWNRCLGSRIARLLR